MVDVQLITIGHINMIIGKNVNVEVKYCIRCTKGTITVKAWQFYKIEAETAEGWIGWK